MSLSALVYDIEIVKAIPGKAGEQRQPNIAYCGGWDDHANMGVSVVGVYDYVEDRYRVFCKDNLLAFVDLAVKRQHLVGFNNIHFDNKVLRANNAPIDDAKSVDLLRLTWKAAGLGPDFIYPSHAGYGLDAVCKSTFGDIGKTGHGALAPIQWQRGEIGAVIDYCLNDIRLTKRLFDRVLAGGDVTDPKTRKVLRLDFDEGPPI